MAKHNDGFGISFNDNDGGTGWFASSIGIEEYRRHVRIMGRWRAKLHFLRWVWIALNNTEHFAGVKDEPRWKHLRGWKP